MGQVEIVQCSVLIQTGWVHLLTQLLITLLLVVTLPWLVHRAVRVRRKVQALEARLILLELEWRREDVE